MVLVRVEKASTRRTRRGRTLVEVRVTDPDETESLNLVFFNQPWRQKQLSEGREAVLFGKVDQYRGRLQMTNPLVDLVGDRTVHRDGPRLREVLDELVADQPRVTVTLVGTLEPVDGVLERLGRDVLLVREADGTATHLPVGAVVEVLVAD